METVRPSPGAGEALLIGVFDGHGAHGNEAALHVSRVVAEAVHPCAAAAVAAASCCNGGSSSGLAAGAGPGDGYSSDSNPKGVGNLAHPTALSADATAGVIAASPFPLAAPGLTLEAARSCLEQVFKRVADSVAAAYELRAAASEMSDSGSTAVVCMVLQDRWANG